MHVCLGKIMVKNSACKYCHDREKMIKVFFKWELCWGASETEFHPKKKIVQKEKTPPSKIIEYYFGPNTQILFTQ